MRIILGRKHRLAPYESIEYEVEVTGDDLPREEDETLQHWMSRAHVEAYKRLMVFESFHGAMPVNKTVEAVLALKERLGLE